MRCTQTYIDKHGTCFVLLTKSVQSTLLALTRLDLPEPPPAESSLLNLHFGLASQIPFCLSVHLHSWDKDTGTNVIGSSTAGFPRLRGEVRRGEVPVGTIGSTFQQNVFCDGIWRIWVWWGYLCSRCTNQQDRCWWCLWVWYTQVVSGRWGFHTRTAKLSALPPLQGFYPSRNGCHLHS